MNETNDEEDLKMTREKQELESSSSTVREKIKKKKEKKEKGRWRWREKTTIRGNGKKRIWLDICDGGLKSEKGSFLAK